MRVEYSARISEQSMGARNLVGIGFVVPTRQVTLTGGIESLESNPGLLKSFKIQEQLLRSPRIDSEEPNRPGCVPCSQAGRYDKPIPTRFL
jgi:hypothetical protein